MLENDTGSDVIPKQVVLQMLGSLSDSIIAMCQATRNVATFVRLSSGGNGDSTRAMSTATTREPNLGSRVPPGDVRSMGSHSRPPSVTTDVSRGMSPAEIRKARRAKLASAETPTKTDTAASEIETPIKAESVADTEGTPETPSKTRSARLSRLASRMRPPTSAVSISDKPALSDSEANSLAIMAEYMSNNRDDPEAAGYAEQIMAAVESRNAKDGAAREALKAVRYDVSKSSNYDAGVYLGLGDDSSVMVSNTYQFCANYPEWVPKI
ncbi:hypothetical protein BDV12DRAFT_200952 [Aspergillus spectabilis]